MSEKELGPIEVKVRDGNVMNALNKLRKEMGKEDIKKELEHRRFYEKPSEKRRRKEKEAKRRREQRKREKEKRKKRRQMRG